MGRALDKDSSWKAKANCLGMDPSLFFPKKGQSTKEAKAVCQGCSVREQCLEFALTEKFGIWGGTSERQRRRLRVRRAAMNEMEEAS